MAKDEDLIEGFNKLAQVYQDKFMDMDLYDDTYDEFCGLIKGHNAKVLEIGCGPGNITRFILNQLPELHIHAIDLSEEMVALARENNPTAVVEVMDCRAINY